MTTAQILQQLKKAGKSISRPWLYTYLRELGISQTVRQRPANYPADTAQRILVHLGMATPGVVIDAAAPLRTAAAMLKRPPQKLISNAAMKAARPQTKTKGTR